MTLQFPIFSSVFFFYSPKSPKSRTVTFMLYYIASRFFLLSYPRCDLFLYWREIWGLSEVYVISYIKFNKQCFKCNNAVELLYVLQVQVSNSKSFNIWVWTKLYNSIESLKTFLHFCYLFFTRYIQQILFTANLPSSFF